MEKNKYVNEISKIILNSNNPLSINEIMDLLFENQDIKDDYLSESQKTSTPSENILLNQINAYIKDQNFEFSNIEMTSANTYGKRGISSDSSNYFYNKIYQGPPGTGKSYKIKDLLNSIDSNFIFRITFHEDYSYYDFVGQYKPIVVENYKDKIYVRPPHEADHEAPTPIISYKFVPGIFIESYICALLKPDNEVFLIIEEINRGNCSAIFGDIFQLLDRDENGSIYDIRPSKELENYLKEKKVFSEKLKIPKNLKIIATMNTSDQSLFPMDSAFKRRWQQEYCRIDYAEPKLKSVLIEKTSMPWLEFIEKINDKILKLLNNEDKQIGQWFVLPINNRITINDFKYKVLSYLYYDVFKHYRTEIFDTESFANILDKNIEEVINEITG